VTERSSGLVLCLPLHAALPEGAVSRIAERIASLHWDRAPVTLSMTTA